MRDLRVIAGWLIGELRAAGGFLREPAHWIAWLPWVALRIGQKMDRIIWSSYDRRFTSRPKGVMIPIQDYIGDDCRFWAIEAHLVHEVVFCV